MSVDRRIFVNMDELGWSDSLRVQPDRNDHHGQMNSHGQANRSLPKRTFDAFKGSIRRHITGRSKTNSKSKAPLRVLLTPPPSLPESMTQYSPVKIHQHVDEAARHAQNFQAKTLGRGRSVRNLFTRPQQVPVPILAHAVPPDGSKLGDLPVVFANLGVNDAHSPKRSRVNFQSYRTTRQSEDDNSRFHKAAQSPIKGPERKRNDSGYASVFHSVERNSGPEAEQKHFHGPLPIRLKRDTSCMDSENFDRVLTLQSSRSPTRDWPLCPVDTYASLKSNAESLEVANASSSPGNDSLKEHNDSPVLLPPLQLLKLPEPPTLQPTTSVLLHDNYTLRDCTEARLEVSPPDPLIEQGKHEISIKTQFVTSPQGIQAVKWIRRSNGTLQEVCGQLTPWVSRPSDRYETPPNYSGRGWGSSESSESSDTTVAMAEQWGAPLHRVRRCSSSMEMIE